MSGSSKTALLGSYVMVRVLTAKAHGLGQLLAAKLVVQDCRAPQRSWALDGEGRGARL